MDPVKCGEEIADAVENDEWERAAELAQDLMAWIDKGGFVPPVTGRPAFDKILLYQTCDSIVSWEVVV